MAAISVASRWLARSPKVADTRGGRLLLTMRRLEFGRVWCVPVESSSEGGCSGTSACWLVHLRLRVAQVVRLLKANLDDMHGADKYRKK